MLQASFVCIIATTTIEKRYVFFIIKRKYKAGNKTVEALKNVCYTQKKKMNYYTSFDVSLIIHFLRQFTSFTIFT